MKIDENKKYKSICSSEPNQRMNQQIHFSIHSHMSKMYSMIKNNHCNLTHNQVLLFSFMSRNAIISIITNKLVNRLIFKHRKYRYLDNTIIERESILKPKVVLGRIILHLVIHAINTYRKKGCLVTLTLNQKRLIPSFFLNR